MFHGKQSARGASGGYRSRARRAAQRAGGSGTAAAVEGRRRPTRCPSPDPLEDRSTGSLPGRRRRQVALRDRLLGAARVGRPNASSPYELEPDFGVRAPKSGARTRRASPPHRPIRWSPSGPRVALCQGLAPHSLPIVAFAQDPLTRRDLCDDTKRPRASFPPGPRWRFVIPALRSSRTGRGLSGCRGACASGMCARGVRRRLASRGGLPGV